MVRKRVKELDSNMVQTVMDDLFSDEVLRQPVGVCSPVVRGIELGFFECELGRIAVGIDGGFLVWLGFVGTDDESERDFVQRKFGVDTVFGEGAGFDLVVSELVAYFAGTLKDFTIPLRLVGTEFQRTVWNALMKIPYGQSLSYSDLATRVGVKNGQRAVGKANGDNPIAILVPCHRVVRADGDLCGYAGGLWRKQRLLAIESGQVGLF